MNLLKEVTKAFLGADTNLDEWEGKVLAQKGTEFKEERQKEEHLKEEKPQRLDEKNKGKEVRTPSVIGTAFEGQREPDEMVIERTEILRPPVVEQVIKPRELIEVQPMVVREREQTELHEVIQPLREKEVLPPVVDTKELPIIEGEFIESQEQFEREYNEVTEKLKSSVQIQDIQKERIVNKPIIQEVVHKKVIEEIQPVIHKETVVPHVLRETQPIHEHIVEAPRLLQENMDQHLESHKGLEAEGTQIETRTKPPIFEEVVQPREVVEVQPIVTRERDVTEVHEVVQPIQAREVLPPVIEEKELPLLERETFLESTEEFQRSYEETTQAFQSSVEVENIQRERIVKQPIVQEIVHKTIVEEIQPVIHKETVVPHIVREVLPIHERIVEAPKLFREELEEKDLGTTFVGLGSAPLSSELEPKTNL